MTLSQYDVICLEIRDAWISCHFDLTNLLTPAKVAPDTIISLSKASPGDRYLHMHRHTYIFLFRTILLIRGQFPRISIVKLAFNRGDPYENVCSHSYSYLCLHIYRCQINVVIEIYREK